MYVYNKSKNKINKNKMNILEEISYIGGIWRSLLDNVRPLSWKGWESTDINTAKIIFLVQLFFFRKYKYLRILTFTWYIKKDID